MFSFLFLLGNIFSYDGFEDNKHYLQIHAPNVDYGFVFTVEKQPYLYCDTILYRN